MSRGVVIWPDSAGEAAVRSIWDALARAGLPSLATHTHRRHAPHVSFVAGADLNPGSVQPVTGPVPGEPIPFAAPAVGVFPASEHSAGGLVLFLAVTPSQALLAEHRRIRAVVGPLLDRPWPFFEIDAWTPHITLAYGIAPDRLADAIAIVNGHLPVTGSFMTGGVEDGESGERWPL